MHTKTDKFSYILKDDQIPYYFYRILYLQEYMELVQNACLILLFLMADCFLKKHICTFVKDVILSLKSFKLVQFVLVYDMHMFFWVQLHIQRISKR